MSRGTVICMVLLAIILGMAGCSGNDEPIKATWIEPQVVGDSVSIPASDVENNKIVHFMLVTLSGDMAFMAYGLEREAYVRSNVCPPCRSVGFSLRKGTLVCDTCLTTFNAKTGDGIEGACVDYPKASVPYEITGGNIVMRGDDLSTAYQNTIKPGWP